MSEHARTGSATFKVEDVFYGDPVPESIRGKTFTVTDGVLTFPIPETDEEREWLASLFEVPETCCYQGCDQKSVVTFRHENYTNACADHVEDVRPWVGDDEQQRDTESPAPSGRRSVSVSERELKVCDAVEFVDALGQSHRALITEVHGQYGHSCGTNEAGVDLGQPSVNLLWVSSDDTKRDGHGRQIERESSLVYRDSQGAHGMFWEFLS